MTHECQFSESDYPPDLFVTLPSGVLKSRLNNGVIDSRTGQLMESLVKLSTYDLSKWLEGEAIIPADKISPTLIIGTNNNSDLKIGYVLRSIADLVNAAEDTPFLSMTSAIAAGWSELQKAGGYTHIIEESDTSLPNSVLQISFPRRGAVMIAYGQEIDIVAKHTLDGTILPRVQNPIQGVVEDYSGEDKKYDTLEPTVMWYDDKVGLSLTRKLNWQEEGQESMILPHTDCVIIFNSQKRKYALKVFERANIDTKPYTWNRMMVQKTYPLTTVNEDIFEELFPKDRENNLLT